MFRFILNARNSNTTSSRRLRGNPAPISRPSSKRTLARIAGGRLRGDEGLDFAFCDSSQQSTANRISAIAAVQVASGSPCSASVSRPNWSANFRVDSGVDSTSANLRKRAASRSGACRRLTLLSLVDGSRGRIQGVSSVTRRVDVHLQRHILVGGTHMPRPESVQITFRPHVVGRYAVARFVAIPDKLIHHGKTKSSWMI
jgi:hypothetical protein